MREKVKIVVAMGLLAALAPLLVGCPGAEVVLIKDEALERAVRAELGQPFGFLTKADMLRLQTLEASAMGIRDLTGLETATNLWWLDLDTNEISDVTPLTDLVNLAVLNLDSNGVFDIIPLAGLRNLDVLNLFDTQVHDIQPLITNANNGGLGPGDHVTLDIRPLSERAINIDVPILQNTYGVNVVLVEPQGT